MKLKMPILKLQKKINKLSKFLYINIYVIMFLFISCDKNNIEEAKILWDDALEFHNNKDINNCIVNLHKIIDKYPKNDKAHMSYYFISEIYLNEYKEYDINQKQT